MLNISEKIRKLHSKILEGDKEVLAAIRVDVGDDLTAD